MAKDLLSRLSMLFPESDTEVSDRIHENPTALDVIKTNILSNVI